jgi:predicted DNA binding CopG/RHH family protein
MQLSRFIEALQEDINAAAGLGDERIAEAAGRLGAVLRGSVGLRLLDTLAELAAELSSQLPSGHIEVRLAGQDPQLVFVEDTSVAEAPTAADDLDARITLRLSEALKASIDAAASTEGISTNAWVVRELSRIVNRPSRTGRVGNRLTGFGRS